jgi:hypothetical protein
MLLFVKRAFVNYVYAVNKSNATNGNLSPLIKFDLKDQKIFFRRFAMNYPHEKYSSIFEITVKKFTNYYHTVIPNHEKSLSLS